MGPAMYNHDKQRERSEERGVRKERSEERKSATEGCLKRQATKRDVGRKRSEVLGRSKEVRSAGAHVTY